MIIDRSMLLVEDPAFLRGNLLMQFKNEEDAWPGVLREWFFLVDQVHLEYFTFCGRMIALALMIKIQIGVVFYHLFSSCNWLESLFHWRIFLDVDPTLYSSCKKILEMDPKTVDQDILSLTFVNDVEEMGSITTIELCPNGKDIFVNSKNRKQYVNLLIQHLFVMSIASQLARFSDGFSDVTTSSI
uniref:HECT-type E3 ubiquitin transferase n=1 Tax=Solanum lycopersicum TaxID=4081 RepID=K4CTR6_SOLLC